MEIGVTGACEETNTRLGGGLASTHRSAPNSTKIYALRDPRTGLTRYIGKTEKVLSVRLRKHISSARRGKPWRVCGWVRKLLEKNLEPVIVLVEVVSQPDSWEEREKYWIDFLEDVCDLTNQRPGGDGFGVGEHPGDTKDRISEGVLRAQRETNLSVRAAKTRRGNGPEVGVYKGVHRKKSTGKFQANFCGEHLGTFDTAREAAHAYDRRALDEWGDECYLNFPEW